MSAKQTKYQIYKTSGEQSALTCHRWAHGWDLPRIATEAHGCTRQGEGGFSSAANTDPTKKSTENQNLTASLLFIIKR